MLSREEAEALVEEYGNVTAAARAIGMPRSTFREALSRENSEVSHEELLTTKKQLLNVRLDMTRLRAEHRSMVAEHKADKETLRYLQKVTDCQIDPPKWLKPSKQTNRDRGIATAFLSDLHLDEVVLPNEVNGLNCYNRTIAELRLKEFFHNTVRLSQDYINGIDIEGLVLPMGGDMLSGNIHEELRETNEAPILDSMFYWAEKISAGIEFLLNSGFKNIYLPCVVGNHGRLDKRPRAKHAVQDNFDWGMYVTMANYFKNVPEVKFQIGQALDLRYQVYDTRYLLTHGDQFKGGSGIAGALSPLMIAEARKRKRASSVESWSRVFDELVRAHTDHSFDYMIMGHWHQWMDFKSILVNGSTKGYDEYAFRSNFDFEPPRQAWWLTDPKHGKTISAPIHCKSDEEDWDV